MAAEVRQVLAYMRYVVNVGLGHVNGFLLCVGLSGYATRLRFWALLPAALVGVILLGSVVHVVRQRRGCSLSAVLYAALPLVLRVLFVLYPLIANVAFEALSCHNAFDDGSRPLIADVSVECHSDYYRYHVVPRAWNSIIIYCLPHRAS
jgi:hypothetical protein